ncbi:MAG: radical SAM protein, partial [Candidatus Hydrothermarchaeota archaeon]
MNYVFGPVPSRRLGMSLGINNIPFKFCSYSCIYCQAGRTTNQIITRRKFYEPREIVRNLIDYLDKLDSKPDVITFVPNGEPTLDINLGKEVEMIKENFSIPVAILSNSSLLFDETVRNDLKLFDVVSLKIDTVLESLWRQINRPHNMLDLTAILDGIRVFSKDYRGRLILETMLVKGVNDTSIGTRKLAEFLRELKFDKIYLSLPLRPPCEKWVKPPDEQGIVRVYSIMTQEISQDKIEVLAEYEKPRFKIVDKDTQN